MLSLCSSAAQLQVTYGARMNGPPSVSHGPRRPPRGIYEEGFSDWDSSIPASVGRPSISRYPSESSSAKCYN